MADHHICRNGHENQLGHQVDCNEKKQDFIDGIEWLLYGAPTK
jgi:hypothetical protein